MQIKILCLIAAMLVFMVGLTGCGNMSMGIGNYSFQKVHVNGQCFTVEKWYDNETGIEVKTKEAGAMYLSEGSGYILIQEHCPWCG